MSLHELALDLEQSLDWGDVDEIEMAAHALLERLKEEIMPKVGDMFSGSYLKASDLQGKRSVVTIDAISQEEVGGEPKWILSFRGKEKTLVLNKTNANMIAEITGTDDSDGWAGKQVVLYPAKTDFQGKRVDCIRVDYPVAKPQPAPDPDETPF